MSANPSVQCKREQALALEFSEQHIWDSMWRSVKTDKAQTLGLQLKHYAGASALMMTSIPFWLFNRVIGLGLREAVDDPLLDELIEHYRQHQLPLGISLCPLAQPEDLGLRLQQRGFSNVLDWAKMIRGTQAPPVVQTDLQLRPIAKADCAKAAEVLVKGFEMPPQFDALFIDYVTHPDNHGFMMWDGDEAAAVGILSVVDGVGHLNSATTLPDFRRRGAQGALMAARIQHGLDLGCTLFATETGIIEGQDNPSLQNMYRMGFELAYRRPNYVKEFSMA